MTTRRIASLTAIALGVLVCIWPMLTTVQGNVTSVFPYLLIAGGLIATGAYSLAVEYISRAAGFGAVLLLFSLAAFAISFNLLPSGAGWGFYRSAPAWDFDRFGAAFASILAIAGVACLFVRDERPARSQRTNPQ